MAGEISQKPRVVIVGATGYIGSKLYAQANSSFITVGTTTKTDNTEGLIQFNLIKPETFPYDLIDEGDVVVITAAISAPDICSNDRDYAWAVNVSGTTSFIKNVINRGARVIFFSSDTVYGEQDKVFDENCALKPAGEYAEMKCEIERLFHGNPSFKSIRISYVFSNEDKFTKYLMGCMKRNEEVEIFHPFYRAVIHREDVIDGVIALIKGWNEIPQYSINYGGPVIISRIEFKEAFNQNSLHKLTSRIIEPPANFFLNRPRVIAMQSPILKNLLGRSTRNIAEAMKREFPESQL